MNSPEKNGKESSAKLVTKKTTSLDDIEFLTGDISGCCGECDALYVEDDFLEDNCE